jgi:hypothetical protein
MTTTTMTTQGHDNNNDNNNNNAAVAADKEDDEHRCHQAWSKKLQSSSKVGGGDREVTDGEMIGQWVTDNGQQTTDKYNDNNNNKNATIKQCMGKGGG